MGKKILVSCMAIVMMFCMVGCNQDSVRMLNDLSRIYSWKDKEEELDITVSIQDSYMNIEFSFGVDSYLHNDNEDVKLYLKAYPKAFKYNNTVIDLTGEKDNIIPFELYVENEKVCIATEIFKEYSIFYGLDAELLEYDYIGIDATSYMETAGVSMNDVIGNPQEILKELLSSDLDVPVTKDGKTYTVQLDAAQILNLYESFMVETMKLQKDNMIKLAVSKDEAKEQIEDVEAGIPENTKLAILEEMNGVTGDIKITSEKEIVNANIVMGYVENYVLEYPDGETVEEDTAVESKKLTIDYTVKQVEPKEFKFPSDVKLYKVEDMISVEEDNDYNDDWDYDYDDDYDDDWDYDNEDYYDDDYYEEPYAGYWGTIPLKKEDMKIIEGDICFPAKKTLAKAGLTLIYDEFNDCMKIKELPNARLYLRTIDGVSYISLYELSEAGIYNVRVEE